MSGCRLLQMSLYIYIYKRVEWEPGRPRNLVLACSFLLTLACHECLQCNTTTSTYFFDQHLSWRFDSRARSLFFSRTESKVEGRVHFLRHVHHVLRVPGFECGPSPMPSRLATASRRSEIRCRRARADPDSKNSGQSLMV